MKEKEIENLIEKRGSGPKTHYVLATTVRYRPISSYKTNIGKVAEEQLKNLELNERQKKATEYIGEYGRITNREYQKLNKVSNKTAYQELSDLLKRQIIEKKGAGKYVYYILRVMQGNAKVVQKEKEEKR